VLKYFPEDGAFEGYSSEALSELIKTKQDAIQVMIYVTLVWKDTAKEIAGKISRLRLKSRDKIVVVGKAN